MQRVDLAKLSPATEPLYRAGKTLEHCGLEPNLIVLLQLRASQINGCAFCIALHVREAEAMGEGRDRLHGLIAWREAPWYNDRERAALEWTESLTCIADGGAPDDLYQRTAAVFSEEELAYLTLAVTTINSWNRFCIAFHVSPNRAEDVFRMLSAQRKMSTV